LVWNATPATDGDKVCWVCTRQDQSEKSEGENGPKKMSSSILV
jgi:hypothetical protein